MQTLDAPASKHYCQTSLPIRHHLHKKGHREKTNWTSTRAATAHSLRRKGPGPDHVMVRVIALHLALWLARGLPANPSADRSLHPAPTKTKLSKDSKRHTCRHLVSAKDNRISLAQILSDMVITRNCAIIFVSSRPPPHVSGALHASLAVEP